MGSNLELIVWKNEAAVCDINSSVRYKTTDLHVIFSHMSPDYETVIMRVNTQAVFASCGSFTCVLMCMLNVLLIDSYIIVIESHCFTFF